MGLSHLAIMPEQPTWPLPRNPNPPLSQPLESAGSHSGSAGAFGIEEPHKDPTETPRQPHSNPPASRTALLDTGPAGSPPRSLKVSRF